MSREVYIHSDVSVMVDDDFGALLEDKYIKKGSGFTLSAINSILLDIYEHTPLEGLRKSPSLKTLCKKKAVINPMNIDDDCFKGLF